MALSDYANADADTYAVASAGTGLGSVQQLSSGKAVNFQGVSLLELYPSTNPDSVVDTSGYSPDDFAQNGYGDPPPFSPGLGIADV